MPKFCSLQLIFFPKLVVLGSKHLVTGQSRQRLKADELAKESLFKMEKDNPVMRVKTGFLRYYQDTSSYYKFMNSYRRAN